MTTLRPGHLAPLVALIVLCATPTRAEPLPGPGIEDEEYQDREFSLGIGYTRVAFTGAENDLNELDALHFNPVMSFAPLPKVPALRLGASVGITLNLEDVSGIISSGGGGLIVVGNADTSLWLFEPELVLSWRQVLGDQDVGLFVEPGITGGGTFAFLDIDDEEFHNAGGFGSPDDSASTWHARAFLRAGMRVSGGIGGFEIAYLRGGELDFGDDTGGELEEFYIGIFGALKF